MSFLFISITLVLVILSLPFMLLLSCLSVLYRFLNSKLYIISITLYPFFFFLPFALFVYCSCSEYNTILFKYSLWYHFPPFTYLELKLEFVGINSVFYFLENFFICASILERYNSLVYKPVLTLSLLWK